MVYKKPLTAAILNFIIPGLGCAYLENWFYAIVFFVWVPLAYLASFVISGFVTSFIQDEAMRGMAFIIAELFLCLRILYEQVSMPYEMAKELNQGIEKNK
jgi:hypothetical protein